MKKKLLIIILLLVTVVTLTACNKENTTEEIKEDIVEDALKFKEEYESLNGVDNNDKTIRSIEISDDNPFIYKEASDIVDMIENKESFIVYFGFAKCPWCRSIIETLIKVLDDYDIDTVYYVDVMNIRDTLKLDEDNNVITDKAGSDGYMKLIELLEDVLDEYTLIDSDGNKVDTKEKRIYAPNVVVVVDGKPVALETGISEKQEDGYQELTREMLNETYEKFEKIIEFLKDDSTCDAKSMC